MNYLIILNLGRLIFLSIPDILPIYLNENGALTSSNKTIKSILKCTNGKVIFENIFLMNLPKSSLDKKLIQI